MASSVSMRRRSVPSPSGSNNKNPAALQAKSRLHRGQQRLDIKGLATLIPTAKAIRARDGSGEDWPADGESAPMEGAQAQFFGNAKLLAPLAQGQGPALLPTLGQERGTYTF